MKAINNKEYFLYLYRGWITASTLISFITCIQFYPTLRENMEVVTSDHNLVIFLPCYFILVFLFVHGLYRFAGVNGLVHYINAFFVTISFVYSLTYMDYPIWVRLAASFYGLTIGISHFLFTTFLHNPNKA
jgi:hypothetical protein